MVMNYLNRKKKLFHFLSRHKDLIVSGTYHTKRNVAFLVNSKQANEFASNFFNEQQFQIKDIIKDIIDKKFRFNSASAKNSFEGTVLLLTWSSNVKIFDLDKKRLLTVCHSIEEYVHVKETYQAVSTFFPLPKVYSFDDGKLSYVEEIVEFVPFRLWDEPLVSKAISNSFMQYSKFYKENEGHMTEVLAHLDEELLLSYPLTKSILGEVRLDQRFKVFKTHGDFWFDNLLYDQKNFYFVDWEYYGDHFFFSDLINMFFAEALMRNDYSYLQRFLNGDFDKEFRMVFGAVDFVDNNDAELRKEMLFLYILERFCKKDGKKTEEDKQLMLISYEEIIMKLGLV